MFIKASRLRAHSSCQNLDCPSGRRPLIRSRTLGFLVSSAAPGGVQAAGSEDEDEDDAKRVVVGAMVIPGGHTLDTRAASAVAAGLRANIRSCSLSLSLSPAGGARFGTPGARSTSAASPPPAISSSTPSASLLARGRAASGRLGGGGSDRLRGASLTDRRHFLGLITSRKGPAIDILIFSGISCAHECTGIFIQWSDFTRGAISTRRGCSSNGRASALHAEGRGIDTLQLHIFFFFLHPKQKSLRAAKQEQSIHSLFPLREAKVNYEGLVGRYARLRSPTVT